MWELPPGQAMCPYHYEIGEEEWLLVLDGEPTLRTPRASGSSSRRSSSSSPPGRTVRTRPTSRCGRDVVGGRFPTATVYPDSDKIGIWTDAEKSTT